MKDASLVMFRLSFRVVSFAKMVMVPITPPCHCFRDFPISEKAYYGIGGEVRFFCTPSSVAELGKLVSWVRSEGMPLAMLGLGSNMLFPTSTFPASFFQQNECCSSGRFLSWSFSLKLVSKIRWSLKQCGTSALQELHGCIVCRGESAERFG